MNAGDTVQVKTVDHAILRRGEEPTPGVEHWIYATVLEELPDGAFVEIAHPGNIDHGARKKFKRVCIRTLEDVQKLHDAHPHRDVPQHQLNFERLDHKEVNNLRAALERLKPKAEGEGA